MNSINHSTTSGSGKTILAVLFLLAVIAAWAVTLILEKQPKSFDAEFPMANARIEWAGAGYNGIYGGGDQ